MGDGYDQATATFISWLKKLGVQLNPKASLVDSRSEGRGRCMVASGGDFEEDELIFSIPRTAILSLNNVLSESDSHGISKVVSPDLLRQMPNWLSLTTVLMFETLRNNSKWTPYLSVLPSKLDSLVFWSADELAALQASAVVNKIGKSKAEKLYLEEISGLGIPGANVELFHRMASIIMAYAFDIPEAEEMAEETNSAEDELIPDDEDEKTFLTMIPLADMLNADSFRNNARLVTDNENDDLEMRAIKPILRGEEIFNDYGQLPRSDLLRRYGYITDNYAIYDVAEVITDSIITGFRDNILVNQNGKPFKQLSATELDARIELAKREDVFEESYDIVRSNSDYPSIPDELVAFVYLLLINDETFASLDRSDIALSSRNKMMTSEVGNVLSQILQLRLKEYGTSLEHDTAILETQHSSHRISMAIKVIRGEKEVLLAATLEAATFQGDNKRMRIENVKRGRQEETASRQKRVRRG